MGLIASSCEHCGHPYRVDARHAGKKGRCSECRSIFRIRAGLPPASSMYDGLDEGPAAPRTPATPAAHPMPPRGPGLLAKVRSAWRRWDRATGRDTETEDMRGLARFGYPMVFFGAFVALMPRTGWVIKGLPAVADPVLGALCAFVGFVSMASFVMHYPLRALRKLLELVVIFGFVLFLTFFVIKPLVWNPRLS